ncbi:MAG: cytochrome B [Cyclobacteriaceae bacterium]|nr:cytochrome B [Cyclobacteriaceae bacterium]
MYTGLLHSHSLLRYFVLIMLVVVVVVAFQKWQGKKPFSTLDNKLSLYLFIFTHLQLLVGLILYWVSPWVKFTEGTMKNAELRYWAVEHISLNIVSIVLITLARTTSKRMSDDTLKHKRLFIFNAIALALIILSLSMSGRGILHPNLF